MKSFPVTVRSTEARAPLTQDEVRARVLAADNRNARTANREDYYPESRCYSVAPDEITARVAAIVARVELTSSR